MTTEDLTGFQTPGRGRGILDIFRWHYLLRLLIRKGTSTRYRNSVLGWTWSYVKPAAQFLVYYFVMGVIFQFHKDIPNFPIYLFSGIVVINLFNEAFGNATHAIVDNRSLVKKIYLPRELFPIASIAGAVLHFVPQVLILFAVCLLVGWAPSFAAVGAFLLGIVLILALSLGLGLFFGAFNVRYRDAQNFVEIIRMLSTWTAPVLYGWAMVQSALPGWAFNIYMLNPISVAVEYFHFAFWDQTVAHGAGFPPHIFEYTIGASVFALATIVVGQFTFKRLERSFAQDL
ncbi:MULTISPECIES: ABC transporter permease [unclassified Leifsonia]|uniref:ABC transporter permease n=1 Tax=unclassified Leifsonia TaxID=2663824 RepID=UPI0006FAB818|nr:MULTISPECIES: ABC transporter permease [unclassified Leifsonia]KQX06371.1 sugar ABC transporter permease [Leifsonia sp. Root1293]KRA10655.1 sugar ABC transporter permease [Leifsonia sp. Root60]